MPSKDQSANELPPRKPAPKDLYQVVIECTGEAQQRELFDRLRREGLKVRLLCL
jgi:hypothetical protein